MNWYPGKASQKVPRTYLRERQKKSILKVVKDLFSKVAKRFGDPFLLDSSSEVRRGIRSLQQVSISGSKWVSLCMVSTTKIRYQRKS